MEWVLETERLAAFNRPALMRAPERSPLRAALWFGVVVALMALAVAWEAAR